MNNFKRSNGWIFTFLACTAFCAGELRAESTNSVSTNTDSAVAIKAPVSDPPAARFLNTCSGCHSLNGIKLIGPDLSPVAAWPELQLKTMIKKMEVKVGPLSDEDIASLAKFLQSVDVHQRLAAEGARIQAQFAAKLDKGNPTKGLALFSGKEALANDGLACVACHQISGHGGRLGPDLTGVYKKMGDTPLMSSLDKVGFKVMAAHYQRHPITRQEAIHLIAYLATVDPASAVKEPDNRSSMLGLGLAVVGFAGSVAMGRRGSAGRARKLKYRKH